MKRIWDRIHVWLAANAPMVLASLRPGATEEAVRAAEVVLGTTFPESVRACYRIHDGQAVSEGSSLGWAPYFLFGQEWYSLNGVVGSWRCLKSLLDDGVFKGRRGKPDGSVRRHWWHPGWVPLTTDHTHSHYCLDLAPAKGGEVGQVITWSTEDHAREVVADSFLEWLEAFADELEEGVWIAHPDYDGLVCAYDL